MNSRDWLRTRVNHPTNTTTMVVPFATTAAWWWQISPPLPQGPLRNGLVEGGVRGFYLICMTGREKIITKLDIFYFNSFSLHLSPPKWWNITPLHAPSQSNLLFIIPYVAFTSFWLVVVFVLISRRPTKATSWFIVNYFSLSQSSPKWWGNIPPHTTSPTSLLPQTLTFGWLFITNPNLEGIKHKCYCVCLIVLLNKFCVY